MCCASGELPDQWQHIGEIFEAVRPAFLNHLAASGIELHRETVVERLIAGLHQQQISGRVADLLHLERAQIRAELLRAGSERLVRRQARLHEHRELPVHAGPERHIAAE